VFAEVASSHTLFRDVELLIARQCSCRLFNYRAGRGIPRGLFGSDAVWWTQGGPAQGPALLVVV